MTCFKKDYAFWAQIHVRMKLRELIYKALVFSFTSKKSGTDFMMLVLKFSTLLFFFYKTDIFVNTCSRLQNLVTF